MVGVTEVAWYNFATTWFGKPGALVVGYPVYLRVVPLGRRYPANLFPWPGSLVLLWSMCRRSVCVVRSNGANSVIFVVAPPVRNADCGHATREHGGNPQVSCGTGQFIVVLVHLRRWQRRQGGLRRRRQRAQDRPHPERAPPLARVAGGELQEDAARRVGHREEDGDAFGRGAHAAVRVNFFPVVVGAGLGVGLARGRLV